MRKLRGPDGIGQIPVGDADLDIHRGPRCRAQFGGQSCRKYLSPHLCYPAALRWIAAYERGLVYSAGPKARQPFGLAPWQRRLIWRLAAPRIWSPDHDRWVMRINLCWIAGTRGIGKTDILAGLCWVIACLSASAQIWIGSRSAIASKEVIGAALTSMLRYAPLCRSVGATWHKTDGRYHAGDSTIQFLPRDYEERRGINPSLFVIDELLTLEAQAQPMVAAMLGSLQRRPNQLAVIATTPSAMADGYERTMTEQARQTAADPDRQPSVLPVIYEMTPRPGLDPWDETEWPTAKPGLGYSVSWHDFRILARRARGNPLLEADFLREEFGLIEEDTTRWIGSAAWAECHGRDYGYRSAADVIQGLHRCEHVDFGIDLSYARDVTALAGVGLDTNGILLIAVWSWLPAGALDEFRRALPQRADEWIDTGEITVMSHTDHPPALAVPRHRVWMTVSEVATQMTDIIAEFKNCRRVGYDKYAAEAAEEIWHRSGLPAIDIPQGGRLEPAIIELRTRAEEQLLAHGGDQGFLDFNVGCMRAERQKTISKTGRLCLVRDDDRSRAARVDAIAAVLTAIQAGIKYQPADDTPDGGIALGGLDWHDDPDSPDLRHSRIHADTWAT